MFDNLNYEVNDKDKWIYFMVICSVFFPMSYHVTLPYHCPPCWQLPLWCRCDNLPNTHRLGLNQRFHCTFRGQLLGLWAQPIRTQISWGGCHNEAHPMLPWLYPLLPGWGPLLPWEQITGKGSNRGSFFPGIRCINEQRPHVKWGEPLVVLGWTGGQAMRTQLRVHFSFQVTGDIFTELKMYSGMILG